MIRRAPGHCQMTRHLLIDTDPGIDDALALLLAMASPGVTVEAITTVAGNVAVDRATANVLRILDVARPEPRPRVARGAVAPLKRTLVTAAHVHGRDGLGNLDRFIEPGGRPRYPEPLPAVEMRRGAEVILEAVDRWGQELTIVALGPLTNLAAALALDHRRLARVGRIVVMGGAIAAAGNVTRAAEFNFYVDPEAAAAVFNAGRAAAAGEASGSGDGAERSEAGRAAAVAVGGAAEGEPPDRRGEASGPGARADPSESRLPLEVVPLDVTRQVVLAKDELAERLGRCSSRIAQFVADFTLHGFAFGEQRDDGGIVLHDPLAVGVALDPTLVEFEPRFVEVECRGRTTRGASVADRRPIPLHRRRWPNCRVAMAVDASRFLRLFLERLCPASA